MTAFPPNMVYFITGKEVTVKEGDTLTTQVSAPTDVKVSTVPVGTQDAGKSAGGS